MTVEGRNEARTDQTIELVDGRTLSYAAYGDPNGSPLLFFPGTPGSRYFVVPDDSIARAHDVRVLVVDRPGYGRSTLDTDLELLDWPDDVVQLMDSLDIDEAAIVGHSGGGAFVLACAHEIPERLSGVGLISSVAPFGAPDIREQMSEEEQRIGELVESAPTELRALGEDIFGDAHEHPETAFEGILAASPEPDRAVLERREIREMMVDAVAEAFRQGTEVWAHESALFFTPWGFDLTDISVHVDLWQGEHDRHVPPFMARYLERRLPNCTVRFSPDDGHTIFVTHWEEILSTLVPDEAHESEARSSRP